MEAFVRETGRAVVIPNDNINTDIILPKQFLKNILKTGFGKDLFYDWRYNAQRGGGYPIPEDIQSQAGWVSEQPDIDIGVSVHCKGVGLDDL